MPDGISRFLRYSLKRGITLLIVVTLAVYATVIIANMGGYVDEIIKGQISDEINQSVFQNPAYRNLSSEEKKQLVDDLYKQEIERLGLDKPFVYRSVGYLTSALSLNLGRARFMSSDSGSRTVRLILLERLPTTILLFTSINLVLFFLSLLGGLFLSRRHGSKIDKAIVSLSPFS